MDVFPKFIIETDDELGDCLIIGKCTYHKQLATFPEKVKGGGWFLLYPEEKIFTFSGGSHDFGRASVEDIQKCIAENKVFTNPSLEYSIAGQYKFRYMDELGTVVDLAPCNFG